MIGRAAPHAGVTLAAPRHLPGGEVHGWDLARDERRGIFEETFHHTAIGPPSGRHRAAIGLEYLSAVARRPRHCRALGEAFDFLTWFAYAPEHEPLFDRLPVILRASREWAYVDREAGMRLTRAH